MRSQRDLTTSNPFLNATQIRAATCVRHVEIHETIGSTNDRAAELARAAQVETPALVVARLQTAGRGRGRNTWWAGDGALTFSLLLDTEMICLAPKEWPRLSLATAVGVCDALGILLAQQAEASSPLNRAVPDAALMAPAIAVGLETRPARRALLCGLQIKWPNDVLLHGGKVCGILIESPAGTASAKNQLILGIGINVNNRWRDAPAKVMRRGATLGDASERQFDLQNVLIGVLNSLSFRFDQLRGRDPELSIAWQQLDFLSGQFVTVEGEGRRIEGRCVEIQADGALVVDTLFGRQRFYSGSIQLA
jgi:BirA family biotin operon repressor/biotin-[acetyl-CoA-carboxylase] ligase